MGVEIQLRQNVGENHIQESVRNFNTADRRVFVDCLPAVNDRVSGLLNDSNFLPQRFLLSQRLAFSQKSSTQKLSPSRTRRAKSRTWCCIRVAGTLRHPGNRARRTIGRFLALILRAYVHAMPPVTRRSLTVLVRIEGAIHAFLVECLSANRASIKIGWPLMSGSDCTPDAWHARHRG